MSSGKFVFLVGAAAVALYAVKIRVWAWLPFLWTMALTDWAPFAVAFLTVGVLASVVVFLDKRLTLVPVVAFLFLANPVSVTEAAKPTPTVVAYPDRWGYSASARIGSPNFDPRSPRPYAPVFTVRDDWFCEVSPVVFPLVDYP